MKRVFIAVALFAAGCATPYQEGGLTGGVRAQALATDIYRVEAQLNAYSSQAQLQDYVLLKAAETALQNNAPAFTIIDAADASRVGAYTAPMTAYTTAQATAVGNTAYGSATTNYYGGQTYVYNKPGANVTIRLLREPIAPGTQFYPAREIVSSIGMRIDPKRASGILLATEPARATAKIEPEVQSGDPAPRLRSSE